MNGASLSVFKPLLIHFPGCGWGTDRRIHYVLTPRRGTRSSASCSSAPALLFPADSPAFPRPASRGRCGARGSLSPGALERCVEGQEAKRAEGRSIFAGLSLYHPLSSSLPGPLGLQTWLLGGSWARRWPRRLPGRLKSGYAGGRRSSSGGLATTWRRAGLGCPVALPSVREELGGWAGAPELGSAARCGRRRPGP